VSKARIEGRIKDAYYIVVAPDGTVMKRIPLAQARDDERLQAAIQRNGWEELP